MSMGSVRSEAKKIRVSVSGAGKGLLQGHARRRGLMP